MGFIVVETMLTCKALVIGRQINTIYFSAITENVIIFRHQIQMPVYKI